MNKSSHGIGLSVCKKIATGLNGTLEAQSQIGKGSIFTFSFKTEKIAKSKDASQVDINKFKQRMHKQIDKDNKQKVKILTAI